MEKTTAADLLTSVNRLRTREDDPWLTARELKQVNFWHSREGKQLLAGFRDFGAVMPYMEARGRVLWRETVLEHRHRYPNQPTETYSGGWLPNRSAVENGSQTAIDLAYRQECRVAGRHEEADLIRRVVEGGSVEVRDYPDGTMWLFQKGLAWA